LPEHNFVGGNTMNRISKFFAISAFALTVLALPTVTSAQWGGQNRDDDYYGNNRNNRNLRATIQNLKNRARNFETATNRAEDQRDDRDDQWGNRNGSWGNNRNGGWNNRGGNYGRLEDLADNFRRATDRLEDAYGNGRNLNGSRDEARRVLDIGNQIENELRNLRGGRNLERQWSQIRNDLNAISNVYGGYYGNGGYNNNRYPTQNGDWRNRVPFPLPF
jgi:hypothetical protein